MTTQHRAVCETCGWTMSFQRAGYAERALARHECPRDHRRSCRRCGWSTTSKTAKLADRAKRQHSCERQIALKEARARGQLRRSLVDRTPKPCLHKIATHVHGTYPCYVLDECRCEPCAAANRAYESDRTRQQAYGRWNGYVDAEPARQHLLRLKAAGMGPKRVAAVSGIAHGIISAILYGKYLKPGVRRQPNRRIRPETEQRILAVELDLADGARVDGGPTARRIQALVANGWSQSKLAARLGIGRANFTPLAHGTRDVTVTTAKTVHALYRELVDVAPPEANQRDRIAASRARRYAAELGWAPPLRIGGRAWIGPALELPALDDVPATVHDLEPVADEAAIQRRMNGDKNVRLTKSEATELVARWIRAGRSLAECERITGLKPDRYRQDGAA